MAYELLIQYRKLAQEIPGTVLNTTHRLIIKTFIEYHSDDKGVYVANTTLAKELALSNRTLLENLHYLGDGQVWRNGKRVPCTNSKCKNHLKIILGSHYARAGKGQVYRLKFENLSALAISMRNTAPTINASVQLEVNKGAPKGESACTTPHPYIPDKPYIRKQTNLKVNNERWHVISQDLPPMLVKQWRHSKESERCLDVILQGTTFKAFRSDLKALNFAQAYDMSGLFMDFLRQASTGKKVIKNKSKAQWCGKCNEVTKLFSTLGDGIDGKETYECTLCHPNQLRIKDRLVDNPDLDNFMNELLVKSKLNTETLLKLIDDA
jgi:hypothetical protein